MINRYVLILLIISLILPPAGMAVAGEPTNVLKAPMDEALAVLRDPQYEGDDPAKKAAQRDKFWSIVAPVFDFEEVSKRTLARHWRNFSAPQQERFVAVFADLLGNIYVDRIQGGYSDETIEFGEEFLHDSRPLAVVKTFVVSERNRIPVDYSMIQNDGRWRIYDVKVEGISLIKNYRSQFKEILSKESPDALIERLQEKVAEQNAKTAAGKDAG